MIGGVNPNAVLAGLAVTAICAIWLPDGPQRAAAQDIKASAKEIIAAQIRKQGYQCENPSRAERDRKRSKPGEAVWVLHCENETYRVRLTPSLPAKVEQLKNDA